MAQQKQNGGIALQVTEESNNSNVEDTIPARSASWRRLSSLDIKHPAGTDSQTKAQSSLTRTDSLNVPGSCPPQRDHHVHIQEDGRESRRGSLCPARRNSTRSADTAGGDSSADMTKLQAPDVAEQSEHDKHEKAPVTTDDSYLRSAIPSLPLVLAVLCLLLNICIPGTGTVLSGISVFCCGRPRVNTKDDQLTTTLCVSIWVGAAQLFTVPLMLVGWFWSLTWGIYMVILAVERRREEKRHREKELQALALTALSSQVRPWTLRT